MERVRINAKETAKAIWTFEATADVTIEDGTIDTRKVASLLLDAVKDAEAEFTADGRIIAGSEPKAT